MNIKYLAKIALLGTVIGLTGCGGGGDSTPPSSTTPASTVGSATPSTSTISLTGAVSKGPVMNATVDIYTFNTNGTQGSFVIGGITTDAYGAWSANIPSTATGPFMIVATGGSFIDEYTGATVPLGVVPLRGILPAGSTSAAITPITDAAVSTIQQMVTDGYASSPANALTTVQTNYVNSIGFDPIATIPPAPETLATASADELKYAAVLGGISTLANDAYTQLSAGGNTPDRMAIIAQMANDFAADGSIDGYGNAAAPLTVMVNGAPQALNGVFTGGGNLATAVGTYQTLPTVPTSVSGATVTVTPVDFTTTIYIDTTSPVITPPLDINITAAAGATTIPASDAAIATFLSGATALDNIGVVGAITNDAPVSLPIGSTVVIFSATDAAGNTGTATATITITLPDTTNPVVTPPANVTVVSTDAAGIAAFLNGATATDNIGVVGVITNDAPASLPLGTTLVTFSATDAAGNTGTATASITLTSATVGGATNVQLTVFTDGWDQNTGIQLVPAGPVANAVVVADGVEYSTDASGNVFIPGLDVGVHDVHVFANGFMFSSLFGYTADPAGNTFIISPVSQVATVGGSTYYDSWVNTLNLQMPAGYVAPANSVLEVTVTDPYGNGSFNTAYNTYDPYGVVYSTYSPINTNAIAPFTSFTATIDIAEITCDPYGFNCTKSTFSPFTQNLSTFDSGTVFSGVATPTNVAVPNFPSAPVAFTGNTTDSQVIMDVNITNSVLAVGTLDVYTQNVGAQVIFSVTDAYGVVNDYLASVQTSYNYGGFTDAYTNVFVPQNTVANNQVTLNFAGIPPGSQVSGHLYVVEGASQIPNILEPGLFTISNYVDLGVVALTTTGYPYIYASTLPASTTVNAAFPLTPVLPVADATQGGVGLELSISNSVYSDPYTVLPSNSFPSLSLSFTTTDVYGNPITYGGSASVSTTVTYDAYGAAITSVDVGPAFGEIFISDGLAIGSSVTGLLTVTESLFTPPNYITNFEPTFTTTQQVDLGLHTFNVGASSQSWKGYNIPLVGIVNTPTPINVVFPVVPPTPTTVLTLQSATPPAGMILDGVYVSDPYGFYSDYLHSFNGPILLPHTFSSFSPPTNPLTLDITASDPYSGLNWGLTLNNQALGSTVNATALMTTPPVVAGNQTGSVINYNAGSGMLMRLTIANQWELITDAVNTSITLPPVPASIANPLVAGQQYDLTYDSFIFSNYTYSALITAFNSNSGGFIVLENVRQERIGDNLGVPYTY